MSARRGFSAEEARRAGEQIGIDWETSPFDVDQFPPSFQRAAAVSSTSRS